eukprot:1161959-Pelagomonas_calceolata.AAC.2
MGQQWPKALAWNTSEEISGHYVWCRMHKFGMSRLGRIRRNQPTKGLVWDAPGGIGRQEV